MKKLLKHSKYHGWSSKGLLYFFSNIFFYLYDTGLFEDRAYNTNTVKIFIKVLFKSMILYIKQVAEWVFSINKYCFNDTCSKKVIWLVIFGFIFSIIINDKGCN